MANRRPPRRLRHVDLTGRVAVVTGANSGVGRSATELLRAAGAEVTLVCRDRTRGEQALSEMERSGPGAAATLAACGEPEKRKPGGFDFPGAEKDGAGRFKSSQTL